MNCHTCPVRYYFERNEPRIESDRYATCKQISYHLGTPLDSDLIWGEVIAVRPDIDPALHEFMDRCIAACRGRDWKQAIQTDVRVISARYGIVGMVDRLVADGEFSIIRAADAPPFGTYSADRLRIAGYALCLQEMTGKEVAGGYVEYIPAGVSRFHIVQPRDRRRLLTTLHKVRSINSGEIPHRQLNAPCARCRYNENERCAEHTGRNINGTRLSELM